MSLCLATIRLFTRTIHTADGGTFDACFEILPDDSLLAMDPGTPDGEKDILRRVVNRFTGLVDEDKAPIPHSPELLEEVLGFADLRIALMREYNRGRAEARSGN